MIAHAMYALECEMIPGEVDDEGPFAEVTGYYARRAPRPVVHVRAIHHRKAPVFQTILSGVEVWNSVGLLGEANVLALVQRQVPGVKDVFFSHGGCGFYHCIVAMRPVRAGWSKQAIMATFAAFPPLKMVTVVDDDVDIRNPMDVEWAMTTRLDPSTGVITVPECFGHGLNPSFPDYKGTKIGFDCTRPCPYTSNTTARRTRRSRSTTTSSKAAARPDAERRAGLTGPARARQCRTAHFCRDSDVRRHASADDRQLTQHLPLGWPFSPAGSCQPQTPLLVLPGERIPRSHGPSNAAMMRAHG